MQHRTILSVLTAACLTASASAELLWSEWNGLDSGSIRRLRPDGTGMSDEVVASAGRFPYRIAADALNGKIYWTTLNTVAGDELQRANLDGSNPEILPADPAAAPYKGIAVDPARGRLFYLRNSALVWADLDAQIVQSINIGSDIQDAVVDPRTGKVYVSSFAAGVHSYDPATGTRAWLSPAVSSAVGLALDPVGDALYIGRAGSTGSTRGIARLPLSGGTVTSLLTGVFVDSLALDPAGQLYWSELSSDAVPSGYRVRSADLGFTSIRAELEGDIGGLAWIPEPTSGLLFAAVASVLVSGARRR